MIETLYIEQAIATHSRVREISARFPHANQVMCERYGAVFNRKSQNFRLQKKSPSLILARKHDNHVLATPEGYGIGGSNNYYFSHMLNCIYDCRYCFLQGMYRSAHYVLFVNYDDFFSAMDAKLMTHEGEDVWFFSGYDCDSLALDPLTGFAQHLLSYLETRPHAMVELRTKSTQIRALLGQAPLSNVIVAFSLTPEPAAVALEHKTPSVAKRISAMTQLAENGWRLGLRFDPLLDDVRFEDHYQALFRDIFDRIDPTCIHSVTIGPFRMPDPFFSNVVRLYPDEPLFAGSFANREGLVTYPKAREAAMLAFCLDALQDHVSGDKIFSCAIDSRETVRPDTESTDPNLLASSH
jgi:spore photoproduct lyase|tara:strand:+ start:696 stop:1754 length:1059 start_codon:yes stop_codon:yes gene_type:complete